MKVTLPVDSKIIAIFFIDKTLQIIRLNPKNNQYENASQKFINIDKNRNIRTSKDGKTIYIHFIDKTLQILRLNPENNQYENHSQKFEDVLEVTFLLDWKTIAIHFTDKTLQIFILNPKNNQYETTQKFKDVTYFVRSLDGQTIAITFQNDTLQIVHFNPINDKYQLAQIFKNVSKSYISVNKTIMIKFKDDSQCYRYYRNDILKANTLYQAMFVLLCQNQEENKKLDLTDTSKENVQQLLEIFNSFDEQTKKILVEKYALDYFGLEKLFQEEQLDGSF